MSAQSSFIANAHNELYCRRFFLLFAMVCCCEHVNCRDNKIIIQSPGVGLYVAAAVDQANSLLCFDLIVSCICHSISLSIEAFWECFYGCLFRVISFDM